jgi:lipopolysaccharide/colanic/teichoic acid biosynthesis glycosyltransferase
MKRSFDFIFSFLGILLLLIPGGIICLFIMAGDGHSPFYFQERVGQFGRSFRLIKFRSMRIDASQAIPLTVGRDPRITRIGHFIRKYKIDELPQLINVWKGDMSLVGPRPEVRKYVDLYNNEQQRVLDVRPGITDYASIQYFDESQLLAQSEHPEQTYIEVIMPAKLQINLQYIPRSGVVEDVKIIFLTFARMLGISKK